ncbi:MAG: multifunctional fatty acid oxidation complex subunit alpha [Crocinitomicaceae bacterium]|nr:multifunctional fatty acid oxidation complex subunit alpha [Crocinitomicaceae bacterium]|tara:strand:+ start:185 stop:2311 length:2127 start_codon:yes stop_codon:yes gene_type:complete
MNNDFFRLEIKNGIATIWIDSQKDKMNIVSPSLMGDFDQIFNEVASNEEIKGAILISAKKDFIAGADIKSFTGEKVGDFQPTSREGHSMLNLIQQSKKPIISAINGTCYGLGTEISLACHGRICSDDPRTKIALPEVKLGLLPGAGGTQRLPRLVGLQKSLDIMLTGKNIFPYPAKKMGLVDEVVNKSKLHKAAEAMIEKIITKGPLKRKVKKSLFNKILDHTSIGRSVVYSQARKKVLKQTKGNYPAPIEIINCVETGLKKGLKAGYEKEVIQFEQLMISDVSKALRNIFFTMTEKKKNPFSIKPRNTDRFAVLGAGFMGAGIAEVSINKGMDVILKDLNEEVVSNAKKNIWKTISKKVKRKQIKEIQAKSIIQKAIGQTNFDGFNNVNIVIEAIVENMDIKKNVIKQLEDECKEDFIFASNTSSLPLTEMSKAAKNPKNVVGMHYFSPVPKMPLLEIIKTAETSEETLSTCYDLGIKQGKTCIVVNDMPGFYVNRILCPYLIEALLMIEEGVSIEDIDGAITKLGMPIGPITLLDEVGIDVGAHVMSGNMAELLKGRKDFKINHSMPKMFEAGLHGRKSKKGFYNYSEKKGRLKKSSPNTDVYQYFGNPKLTKRSEEEINERTMLMLLNEAVWCLEDNIIENAKDGDIGAVLGVGFLPWSGGPFSYMNLLGIDHIVSRMRHYASIHGPKFNPRPMLIEMAKNGTTF